MKTIKNQNQLRKKSKRQNNQKVLKNEIRKRTNRRRLKFKSKKRQTILPLYQPVELNLIIKQELTATSKLKLQIKRELVERKQLKLQITFATAKKNQANKLKRRLTKKNQRKKRKLLLLLALLSCHNHKLVMLMKLKQQRRHLDSISYSQRLRQKQRLQQSKQVQLRQPMLLLLWHLHRLQKVNKSNLLKRKKKKNLNKYMHHQLSLSWVDQEWFLNTMKNLLQPFHQLLVSYSQPLPLKNLNQLLLVLLDSYHNLLQQTKQPQKLLQSQALIS